MPPELTEMPGEIIYQNGLRLSNIASDITLDPLQTEQLAVFRLQWTPGPVHLLRDPAAALGGIPETQASLRARNDFMQHAGNAMLHWADVLRDSAR